MPRKKPPPFTGFNAAGTIGHWCPGDMADFECTHGRLPSDPGPACGCWPNERRKPAAAAA
jgi:hypothetical protein